MQGNELHEFDIKWELDPRELRLREIAAYYHEKTEIHDKKICTGVCPYDGSSMPVTSYQFRAVNEHARIVLNDLYDIGIREGFTKSDILNAIRNYWNYTK